MRNVITILLALPLLLNASCGEDSPAFDNKAACENFINAFNDLECTAGANLDAAQFCSAYDDSSVDCSEIFDCYTANMECTDVAGTKIINNYTEGCPTSCK